MTKFPELCTVWVYAYRKQNPDAVLLAYQVDKPFDPSERDWDFNTLRDLREFKQEGGNIRVVQNSSELVLSIDKSRKLVSPFPLHLLKELRLEELVTYTKSH